MKKFILLLFIAPALMQAQNNNGTIDMMEEFATKYTVPFTMPDGTRLKTDVYVPVIQDDLTYRYIDTIQIFLAKYPVDAVLTIMKKGTQIVYYDSLNGQLNPNPYQLPLIFTRTPYGKSGSAAAGSMIALLGYAYAMQDMRGRYTSEGVYFPMFSDSWKKSPYHSSFSHILDVTALTNPLNANNHEDGYHSVLFINDSLKLSLGNPASNQLVCNGSIGMFGASALGNTQYQAAAAHRVNPSARGLKSLLPIVATNEHYKYTGFQNGVFRERIVTGWLRGQILDLDDTKRPVDYSISDSIHSSKDYNLPSKFAVAKGAIEHFTYKRYFGDIPGYYPNSKGRSEMDASRARVDATGEGSATGTYSRYTNSNVAAYHLSGWWDIFTDGQIETHAQMVQNLTDSMKKLQKLVIGPWAHQTIGTVKTGDMTYKNNVLDITKFDVENVDPNTLPLNQLFDSELITWFRATLNDNSYKSIGAPKYIIPESQTWQPLSPQFDIRIPSKNYLMRFEEMFNFMAGAGALNNIPYEVKFLPSGPVIPLTTSVPATGKAVISGLDPNKPIGAMKVPDFANGTPNVRFYVVGPVNDGVSGNENKGNYWFSAKYFPLGTSDKYPFVQQQNLYLHNNYTADFVAPSTDEGVAIYVHDPDDPVKTVGGGNMIVKNPNGDGRNSQGQMDLAEASVRNLTMDRQGVLKYVSAPIVDSLSIIGYPVATVYAKSSPAGATNGPTDTDFFVRILDVYPADSTGKVHEYFVVEGCVNARAREYAKSIANDNENDNAPFSNINIGQIYEYKFKMMPIAYTWGKNHRIKILISSSNHTRYQSHHNLPLNDGDFFLRYPLDGKSYTFNGQAMYPRLAVQRIAFAPQYPTNIALPVYTTPYTYVSVPEQSVITPVNDLTVFPNPASAMFQIFMNKQGDYNVQLFSSIGQLVHNSIFSESSAIDVRNFKNGIYFLHVRNTTNGEFFVRKISVSNN